MSKETKTERIEARTSPAVRQMIEQAAMLEGRSLSDFIISKASEGARKTIQEFSAIKLAAEDQQAFAKGLLNSKPVPEALKRALIRHDELIGPS
jgi:uncharacterized protein (DUF1778 family)